MIEIPLTADPKQLFSITLSEATYDVTVELNSRQGIWYISFAQGGTDIANGIAIVGGVDIVKQHNIPITNMNVVV